MPGETAREALSRLDRLPVIEYLRLTSTEEGQRLLEAAARETQAARAHAHASAGTGGTSLPPVPVGGSPSKPDLFPEGAPGQTVGRSLSGSPAWNEGDD